MRRAASFLSPFVITILAACGARTDLADPASDALTLADGGTLADGAVATDGGVQADAALELDGSVDAVDGSVPPIDAAAPPSDGGRDGGRDAGRRDSGTTPTPDAGSSLATCTACAFRSCPQQASACLSSTSCTQGLACAAQCLAGAAGGGGFACVQACNIPQSEFQTIAGLLQCLDQNCQSACASLAGG